MNHIPAATRRAVVLRAGSRCEYCGLPQAGQNATFHIDHVLPRASGGGSDFSNLALACVACSLHKGAQAAALDPATRRTVRLFHPRSDAWSQHFAWRGIRLLGLTAQGRATIAQLRVNSIHALGVRMEEKLLGRHPPPMR